MNEEENLKKHNNMTTDQYYSIEEVAKMLKVAYLTVYRWIQSGKLRSNKAGKQYRIEKEELKRFIGKTNK